MEILFLGTGASVPSRDRSTSCIALRSGSDIILMDCGEGSQRQIMVSPFSFMKIRAILITHLHGDHILGLPGLLQTMSLLGRTEQLSIYGPAGFSKALDSMMAATDGETSYQVVSQDVDPGQEFMVRSMKVSAFATDHGVPSVGFSVSEPDVPGKLDRQKALALGIKDGPDMARLKRGEAVGNVRSEDVVGPVQKGVRVVYTGDTMKSQCVEEASKGADVLIHECTYMDSEAGLAKDHFHSTAVQAAETAKSAGVRYLMLTHVSARYDDEREEVLSEAKAVFEDSYLVDDFDHFDVSLRSIRTIVSQRSYQLQHVRVGDQAHDSSFLSHQDGVAVAHQHGHQGYRRAVGDDRERFVHHLHDGGHLHLVHGVPLSEHVEDVPLRYASDRDLSPQNRKLGVSCALEYLRCPMDAVRALDGHHVLRCHVYGRQILVPLLFHGLQRLEKLHDGGVAGGDFALLYLRDGALAYTGLLSKAGLGHVHRFPYPLDIGGWREFHRKLILIFLFEYLFAYHL